MSDKINIEFNYKQFSALLDKAPRTEDDIKTLKYMKSKRTEAISFIVFTVAFLALTIFALVKKTKDSEMQISGFPWLTIAGIALIVTIFCVVITVKRICNISETERQSSNFVEAVYYKNLYVLSHIGKITNYAICVISFLGTFILGDLYGFDPACISFAISAVCGLAGLALSVADYNTKDWMHYHTCNIICDQCSQDRDNGGRCYNSWYKCQKVESWIQGKIQFATYREKPAANA